MKNNFFINFFLLFFFFHYSLLIADELNIKSTKIQLDKEKQSMLLQGSVSVTDQKGNSLTTNFANYDKKKDKIITKGQTEIITSEKFIINSTNVSFDNKNNIIFSSDKTKIIDKDQNEIYLDKFNYSTETNIFTSQGKIKLKDIRGNEYFFSEIYIDEKQKKIIGSDVKAFLNQKDAKINEDNEPRFFANTFSYNKNESQFNKGVFTYCKQRENERCPPWQLRAKKIRHDSLKKTIYYDSATLKVFDFPIFYFPKISHPDPTVDRRSGFLVPEISDNETVGFGFTLPYYWAISDSRDFTFTPKFYNRENPILFGEFRQDFRKSYFILDTSYSAGYKEKSIKKSEGSRAHLFSKFVHKFIETDEVQSNLELKVERVSNDTYFKVHDIKTSLVDNDANILESSLDFNYQKEDLTFGLNLSAFENITQEGNKRWEYFVPYINFGKNLIANERFGIFDFTSNFQVRNFSVDKQTEFFVNDFDWKSNKWLTKKGFANQFLGKIKTVNYDANNTSVYKSEGTNTEVSGALGFLSKLALFKEDIQNNKKHFLTPKLLFRYAPGHMRDLDNGRLQHSNLFELNKLEDIDVIESGLSASLGLDYSRHKVSKDNKNDKEEINFSIGQVISDEENTDMPSSSSMDQRFSDVVGYANYNISDTTSIKYNFAIDQNYKEINYNEIGVDFLTGYTKFNVAYLEEKNHIGNEEYIKLGLDIDISESGKLSFNTKRNLLSNSAEFYNLSYDYINDCLKAGIVFRREFYRDRDIEPENSIFFKITLTPIGEINTPKFTE